MYSVIVLTEGLFPDVGGKLTRLPGAGSHETVVHKDETTPGRSRYCPPILQLNRVVYDRYVT